MVRSRAVRVAAGLTVVTAVMTSAHYYVWRRLLVDPGWGERWHLPGAIALALLAVGTPLGVAFGSILRGPLGRVLALAAYGWLGVLTMLFFGLVFTEPVRLATAGMIAEPLRSRGIAWGLVTLVAIGVLHGVAAVRRPVEVREVEVKLARLRAAASGYRIVQLTDVHIGPTLKREWLAGVVERVNRLDPGVVVITGDLVDGPVERLREHVAPLAALRARDGVYFVTGNHEYYSGADAWLAELERLGVRPLRNERVAIGGSGGFDLAGVDDINAFGPGHGPDLDRALADRDETRELVLLAHQPRMVRAAAARSVGLQLSGHTHGGQIFPWSWFVRLQQPFVAGLHRVGDTQLYVSRGTGYWGPPMRVLAPAEITLIRLVAASDTREPVPPAA